MQSRRRRRRLLGIKREHRINTCARMQMLASAKTYENTYKVHKIHKRKRNEPTAVG
jgi:hypothetical protein